MPKLYYIVKEIKKNYILLEIVWYIITKGISNKIAFNIINLKDPKEI